MMLTDWGTPAAAQNQKYNLGYASAWLQMSANWVCSLFYMYRYLHVQVCSILYMWTPPTCGLYMLCSTCIQVCSLLYMWTLVAPKLFPNRDFS